MSYFRRKRIGMGDASSGSSASPSFAANMCDPNGPFYYQNNPAIDPSQYPQFASDCAALATAGGTCATTTPNCTDVAGLSFFNVGVMNPDLAVGCQCTLPSGAAATWNGTSLSPVTGGALSTADVAALQAAGWTSSQMGRNQPVQTMSNPFGTLVPNFANNPGGLTGTAMLVIGGGALGLYLLSRKSKSKPVMSRRRSMP